LKVNYSWAQVLACPPLLDLIEPEPEKLYTIIYSSGTSGSPKGAMFTNQTIANYLTIFPKDLLRIKQLEHYRLVSYLPLAHVYERSAIQLASVAMNCNVSFVESLERFIDNLKEIQPHFFTAVPRIWGVFQQKIEQKLPPKKLNLLLKIPFISSLIKKKIINGLGLNECTNCFSGASQLPDSILNFFKKLGLNIQEGYGQTENLAYATLSLLDERRQGYVGTPRLKVELKVGNDSELLFKGPCIMSGYYKDKIISGNTFTEEGWLKTGDIAELDERKRVKILGRLSENFKNQSGEFIAPSRIEKQFEFSSVVEQLCLVGRSLVSNVLLVSLSAGALSTKNKEEINKELQEQFHQVNGKLVKYEKISHIIVVKDSWTPTNNMLTPTLKVKRKSVEQHYSELIHEVLKHHKPIIWE
jgi:long-subunit acyl-CoA synthetase (AMP-forming)